jgi:hypothetical protein
MPFRSVTRKGGALARPLCAVALALCVLAPALAGDVWPLWKASELPGGFSLCFFPSLALGTHDSYIGLSARGWRLFELEEGGAWPSLGLGAFASGRAAAASLGMEESGLILSGGADVAFELGRAVPSAPSPWPDFAPRRALSARYEWIAYLDTMGTSQSVGLIELTYSGPDGSLGLAMENDLFGLRRYPHDEYRTTAAELAYATRPAGLPFVLVIALGLKLWTGSTWGESRLSYPEAYSMAWNADARYRSAGLLYLGLGLGPLRLELGWDSESIRDLFQNGVHLLIDDGVVPLVDRADRPYLAVKFHPNGDLY